MLPLGPDASCVMFGGIGSNVGGSVSPQFSVGALPVMSPSPVIGFPQEYSMFQSFWINPSLTNVALLSIIPPALFCIVAPG